MTDVDKALLVIGLQSGTTAATDIPLERLLEVLCDWEPERVRLALQEVVDRGLANPPPGFKTTGRA